MGCYIEEKLFVAASAPSLSSTHEASVYSEISSIPPYLFWFKIFPMERSSESQSYKKVYRPDFELH